MDVAAPFGDLGMEVGNAVVDAACERTEQEGICMQCAAIGPLVRETGTTRQR